MKKALVVGIIILFLGVSVLPIVSSNNVSSPIEMLLAHGNESDENGKLWDDYNEIISTVRGDGFGTSWNYDKGGHFVIYDLRLASGRYYINSFTRDPLKLFYHAKAKSIHMKIFIGWCWNANPDDYHQVIGIAIGDITWEPYE